MPLSKFHAIALIPIIAASLLALPAEAIPKAAEDENAPVTVGADPAKPPRTIQSAKKTGSKQAAPKAKPQSTKQRKEAKTPKHVKRAKAGN